MTNQHTALPMPQRFWDKVEVEPAGTTCWVWRGSVQRIGYGVFRKTVAHRVAYELSVGPVPGGLELDHLCGNRACVNPAHLEPVSRHENVMRSSSFAAANARKTHCPNGHPYSGENLQVRPNGDRRCRACIQAANRARYVRLSVADGPGPEERRWPRWECSSCHRNQNQCDRIIEAGRFACCDFCDHDRAALPEHREETGRS